MTIEKDGAVLPPLRTLFDSGAIGGLSDVELLERFANSRGEAAEAAFAVLVGRHGPMVLRVCRGVLADPHDADDAFQATFLVLVRKARALWVRDSLGPWLHQVAYRTACCARADATRRRRIERGAAEAGAASRVVGDDTGPIEEWRRALHEELARLPERYRAAVVLCDLEGCPHERAAGQLGCAVGTVKSRLARGRKRLRDRLARRGLAPPAGVTGLILAGDATRAAVPAALAATTIRAASRFTAETMMAGVASASVARLTAGVLNAMTLTKLKFSAAALLAGGLIATGVGVWAQPAPAPTGGASAPAARPRPPSPREQFEAIRAEREEAQKTYVEAMKTAATRDERRAVGVRLAKALNPDGYTRRMLALGEQYPDDPAGRDALLWVINQSWRADVGEYGDEFARAAALLVRHHADDPEAVRAGLTLDNSQSFGRDVLLMGFYASAEGRDPEGLARMALAKYLANKAGQVAYARTTRGRPKIQWRTVDADGKPISKEMLLPDDAYAYHIHLRQCDPGAIRAEAERLFEEVIAEYADIPYLSLPARELEALLNEPAPTRDGRPLSERDLLQIKARSAARKTLAEVARARLDEMRNPAVGKPAPEIEGVDLEGRPMKLSDYRGKVVVLDFWDSSCDSCLLRVPDERALVERRKGKPFVLLGINRDHAPSSPGAPPPASG